MASKTLPENQDLKYRDLISKSPAQQESEESDLKVQEAKSHLELTIAQTNRDLAVAKRALSSSRSAIPYDVSKEATAFEEVEKLERGLIFAKNILETRF